MGWQSEGAGGDAVGLQCPTQISLLAATIISTQEPVKLASEKGFNLLFQRADQHPPIYSPLPCTITFRPRPIIFRSSHSRPKGESLMYLSAYSYS